MKNTYIIFITENDIRKKGLPIYKVKKTIEDTDFLFEDDFRFVKRNCEGADRRTKG
ncbi:MAG: hypothetical protein MJ183_08730 [Treponemataceae bacterium]|nr:hypothetical protein [Treponemataceae bacterium]